MQYHKQLHSEPPEKVKSRQDNVFLFTLAAYLVICLLGMALDLRFWHNIEDRIVYRVMNLEMNKNKCTADLFYEGNLDNYPKNMSNPILQNLKLEILLDEDKNKMSIRVINAKKQRFQVPDRSNDDQMVKVRRSKRKQNSPGVLWSDLNYTVKDEQNYFCMTVSYRNISVLNFTGKQFVFADKLIQFGTQLPTPYLWGLGQRNTESFLYDKSGNYTMWGKSQPSGVVDEGKKGQQANGYHPMFLTRLNPELWAVFMIETSNPLLFQLNKGQNITFQILGGIFHLKIFLGSEPSQAIEAYHREIGGYVIPPFWATGYHQSRRGYNNSEMLLQVYNNFTERGLPLEAIWSDIDYMNNYQTFTIDKTRFDPEVMNRLMWIPTIPNGIHITQSKQYEQVLIHSSNINRSLVGCGLPGSTYYLDFNHNETIRKIEQSITQLIVESHNNFKGVNLIGTEISNMVDGELKSTKDVRCQNVTQSMLLSSNGVYDNFSKYVTDNNINWRSIPLNALYYNKENAEMAYMPDEEHIYEYDFHNLYSLAAIKTYYKVLLQLKVQQPLVMSSGSFAGAGRWAGHIVEDSLSDFDDMAKSIGKIFNFQLFGMPFTGVDVCGREGNATAELCSRWMALGSMYPFMRNHNSLNSSAQEPYAFQEEYVLAASKASLRLRYSLLKYYYTIYAANYGVGTVFSPLFVHFPYDQTTLTIENEAMIGPALLITPVLVKVDRKNVSTISPYFPPGYWYSIVNKTLRFAGGRTEQLTVMLDEPCPTWIREGYIVIMQNTTLSNGSFVTRAEQLNNVFRLLIALSFDQHTSQYFAQGNLIRINDYSSYKVECIDSDVDCVLAVVAFGTLKNNTLTMTTRFSVDQVDDFTDFVISGMDLYIQNYQLAEVRFEQEIHIGGTTKEFTKIVQLLKEY